MGNLFNRLFTFRPRENSSAEENFLTESFAYFLERDKAVLEAFINRLLGRKIEVIRYELTTRLLGHLPGKIRFPDLQLTFEAANGETYVIISEHKWNSDFHPGQLADYEEILRSITADHRHLVTIVAHPKQKRDAELAGLTLPAKDSTLPTKHLLWEDIYSLLNNLSNKDPLLGEFLEFMETNNLNPGRPIDSETMKAFLSSSGFKAQLIRFTNKLLNEYHWDGIPKRYRAKLDIRDRFGRVGIEFQTAGWNPGLVIGFLYDTRNHLVSLTAPGQSVDLFLRIEADPETNPQIEDVLALLRQKAKLLSEKGARVLTRGESENGNPWTLLIAQRSLLSVVADGLEERGQIEAIYNRIHEWIKCLFEDGLLEKSLSGLNPVKSAMQVDTTA
jgi:hypothetical protein